MTHEQRKTLHRILLDAKAEIKDGELISHHGGYSHGICTYVKHHELGDILLRCVVSKMYHASPMYKGWLYVAPPYDFSHPDRLALLDWMINETKP